MEKIKIYQFKEKLELLGYSRRSVKDYPYEVSRFFKYLEEHEDVESIDNVTMEHITGYHTYLQYKEYKPGKYRSASSVRRLLGAIKTFYTIMSKENLLKVDLSHKIPLPKPKQHLPRNVPSQKRMTELLQVVHPHDPLTIRDRCIIELLYATGIRNEELRELKVDSYDCTENTIFVNGKGNKDRIVPVGTWVKPYIMEYLEKVRPYFLQLNPLGTDILFLSKNGNKITGANLWWMLNKYTRKAGVGRLYPHALRHACATHLLQNGADIRWVQELLGHSKLSSTQIYTKIDITFLKKAHKKYHPRERG